MSKVNLQNKLVGARIVVFILPKVVDITDAKLASDSYDNDSRAISIIICKRSRISRDVT